MRGLPTRAGVVIEFYCNRFRLGVGWDCDLRLDSLHPYRIQICGALEARESGARACRDEGR